MSLGLSLTYRNITEEPSSKSRRSPATLLFDQRRFGLGCPSLYQVKWQEYTAGECVDSLDDYDFPARTITDNRRTCV